MYNSRHFNGDQRIASLRHSNKTVVLSARSIYRIAWPFANLNGVVKSEGRIEAKNVQREIRSRVVKRG